MRGFVLILSWVKLVIWSNWLEEVEVVLICVLIQAIEAGLSVQASNKSGAEGRRYTPPVLFVTALISMHQNTV